MTEPSPNTFGGGPPIPDGDISGHSETLIIVVVVFTVLSTICVAVRFSSRIINKAGGLDDWASLGALLFSYGFLSTVLVNAILGGSGYHIWEVTGIQFEEYCKIDLANDVIYQCSITLSKYAVLILYLRIFNVRTFQTLIWIVMVIVGALWIACVFGLIFASDPVQAQWEYWLPHTSINNKAFWLAAGILNICLDFAIISMPQPLIWKLQISVKKKVMLTLLFALGLFTCVCSILRCVYISRIDFSDPTYDVGIAGMWTNIELNMSIICSCGPSFPSLFRSLRGGSSGSLFSFKCCKSGFNIRGLIRRKNSVSTGSRSTEKDFGPSAATS